MIGKMPTPVADHDPVGRHGYVLAHDLYRETPYADLVDEHVHASATPEYSGRSEQLSRAEQAETRRAQIAVADTVSVVSVDAHHSHAA